MVAWPMRTGWRSSQMGFADNAPMEMTRTSTRDASRGNAVAGAGPRAPPAGTARTADAD
ncbi:MAG: hypothetical protein DHS20C14_03400 [Phycisphaeraceae bacterium]|nr:MAG: hypothetical protein DHS20C14_03400 [Phycisphaeraceae bacterium]